jgi:hypothetical protein
MYTDRNFKTKKALKEAVSNGETVTLYQPNGVTHKTDGTVYIEGPHYPAPHTWYAQCEAKNGKIIKVK